MRGFAKYGPVLPEPFVELARRRIKPQVSASASFVYLDLDPADLLLARCVDTLLPLAFLAFGNRAQLLRAQLTETPSASTLPDRSWHRDLPVDSTTPVSLTAIFYLDDVLHAGHTYVIPAGSHPPAFLDHSDNREIAITACAGDCLVLSGSVWHTGSAPSPGARRRALILQFGYWWIKQQTQKNLEAGFIEETVYGRKSPPGDLYIHDR